MIDIPEIKRIHAALEIVMTQRDDLKTVLTRLLKESRTYLEESEICMSDSDFELNGCLGNAHAELKVILFPLAKQALACASSTHQSSPHFSPQPAAQIALTDAEIERLRKDASRYRFIRDADRSDTHIDDIALYAMGSLDEYIDTAMKEAL